MANSQNATQNSQRSSHQAKTSVIAQGTIINGDFSTNENLRIDGSIIGNVKCEKRLVIGDKGMINGKIEAAEIAINGKMLGEAISKGIISLGPKSVAEGKIQAIALTVDEGAIFNGDFIISKK